MSRRKGFQVDRHQRQTQIRLVVGGFVLLITIGGGLVWILYGASAAFTAIACILGFGGILGLLWLLLTLLEHWVKDDEL